VTFVLLLRTSVTLGIIPPTIARMDTTGGTTTDAHEKARARVYSRLGELRSPRNQPPLLIEERWSRFARCYWAGLGRTSDDIRVCRKDSKQSLHKV